MAVFSDAFLRLRQELDRAHENRQKLIHDIRVGVQEMALQTGCHLAEQSRTRHAEFTSLMTDLRGQLKQQADATRGQLAELSADLRRGGEVFGRRASTGRRSRKL